MVCDELLDISQMYRFLQRKRKRCFRDAEQDRLEASVKRFLRYAYYKFGVVLIFIIKIFNPGRRTNTFLLFYFFYLLLLGCAVAGSRSVCSKASWGRVRVLRTSPWVPGKTLVSATERVVVQN